MSDKVVKFYPAEAACSADAVLEQAVGVYDEVLMSGDYAGPADV